MLRLVLAAALLPLSTAALACQCDDPLALSEAEKEEWAGLLAVQAVTIAEVQRTGDDVPTFRVVKHLFGERRPLIVDATRAALPNSPHPQPPVSSCDYGLLPGQTAVMAFLPAHASWPEARDIAKSRACGLWGAVAIAGYQQQARDGLRPAGMCQQYFIQSPGMLDRVRRSAARLGRAS